MQQADFLLTQSSQIFIALARARARRYTESACVIFTDAVANLPDALSAATEACMCTLYHSHSSLVKGLL
jgi:hypothetical protein